MHQTCCLTFRAGALRALVCAAIFSLSQFFIPFSAPTAQSSDAAKEMRSVSDALAGDLEMAAFAQNLTNHVQQWAEQNSAKLEPLGGHKLAWGLGFMVCLGALIMVRYIPRFISVNELRADARLAAAAAAAACPPAHMVDEEKSFTEFAARFRVGPPGSTPHQITLPDEVPAIASCARAASAPPAEADERFSTKPIELVTEPAVPAGLDPVQQFFSDAPLLLEPLRATLEKFPGDADSLNRILPELIGLVSVLKSASEVPELAPLWQLTTALNALLEQLVQKKRQVTASTTRTISAALQLIEKLAHPGVPADLAADPPVRVLAVDDDPISRHAVSFALKKALNLPELANEGESALALATETLYDAIFLDIQMPGMDGFELCKRIHESTVNKNTPIVFITCQSDFEAQEKSLAVGACDLISKPFLTFEVTLKALTLVLAGRLEKHAPSSPSTVEKPEELAAAA